MLAFLLSLAALIGGYFIYYLLATMFPIDKLIGNIYPLFALVPAMFMTVVSVSYLLVAPSPEGLALDYSFDIWTGVAVSAIFTMLFARSLQRREAVSIKDLEA